MNILMVYPEYPDTFWSFKHALKYIGRKAFFPPLGLLTIASMLPEIWERKLVDLNVTRLKDKDIRWADYVFISAMLIQRKSAEGVIARCNALGTKVVAGGPLFTARPEDFPQVDHLVLGEGEASFPAFLKDAGEGIPARVYTHERRPKMCESPVPQWELIRTKDYACMAIQYSRGCPFNCEFCDIITLNGRVPRTKSAQQLTEELKSIHDQGWRGPIFIVDDNFIGNKRKVKEVLREVARWNNENGRPFSFTTEASLNLGEDEELMQLMARAGFTKVFIGLETPEEASLLECSKYQNTHKDPITLVKTIQHHGLEVMGGFIIGFDHDSPSIFESQIRFIQNLGVVTAMVGLLNALPGSRLYSRLQREGRLLKDSTGNNLDFTINFIPKMDSTQLVEGYKQVLQNIYSSRTYYERIYRFLEEYQPAATQKGKILVRDVWAFVRSLFTIGVLSRCRFYYWKLIAKSLVKYPRAFPQAVTLAILGEHFRKVIRKNYALETEER